MTETTAKPVVVSHETGSGDTQAGLPITSERQASTTATQPEAVCATCGALLGRFLAATATWHQGVCGVCAKLAPVTQPRDFGGLRPEWRVVAAKRLECQP